MSRWKRWQKWANTAIELLKSSKRDLQSQINDLREGMPKVVTCEKCGCLVLKENAVVGKPIIVDDGNHWEMQRLAIISITPQFKIHTPYYCKLHAPKPKKEKN